MIELKKENRKEREGGLAGSLQGFDERFMVIPGQRGFNYDFYHHVKRI